MSDELKSFEEIERAILVRKLERCLELLKEKDIYPGLIERQLSTILSHGVALYGVTVLEGFVQPVIEGKRIIAGYCRSCGKDPSCHGSDLCQSCEAVVRISMEAFDKEREDKGED